MSDSKESNLGDWADISAPSDDEEPIKKSKSVDKSKPVEPKKDKPKIDIPDNIRYSADHPKWGRDDSINFYKNGTFKRVLKNKELGKWVRNNNELILNWKNWDPENLITNDNGVTFEGDNGFLLKLSKSPIVKEVPQWF